MSRVEEILESILGDMEYTDVPRSRVEALLIAIGELISNGGASPSEIQEAINKYLERHPELIDGVDSVELSNKLKEVFGS